MENLKPKEFVNFKKEPKELGKIFHRIYKAKYLNAPTKTHHNVIK